MTKQQHADAITRTENYAHNLSQRVENAYRKLRELDYGEYRARLVYTENFLNYLRQSYAEKYGDN